MATFRSILPVALVCAIALYGCNNEFDPKTTFQRHLAVFAVLDPTTDTQAVRLVYSYDAQPGYPPAPLTDREVRDARVVLRGDGKTIVFPDTLLPNPDGSTTHVWLARGFRPREDHSYTLTVTTSEGDSVTGTALVPRKLYVETVLVPTSGGVNRVRVRSAITNNPLPPPGYYYRLWVVLRLARDGVQQELRSEVPVWADSASGQSEYSTPSRESSEDFPVTLVRWTHDRLVQPGDSIIARQVLAQAYGMDEHYYSWYKLVRGFDDPVSVRLDRPDVSFVTGGLGVVGGLSADSVRSSYFMFSR
jgi:hypothetical protein